MPGIKEKVENNVAVWMLGTLLAGFLAGIGTYEGALKIMSLEAVSKDRLKQLEESAQSKGVTQNATDIYSVPLPDYLNTSELELIFTRIREAYNKRDAAGLYKLMGPITRSQVSENTATLQIEPLFDGLGKIVDGFYVQHQFVGKQGLYRSFMLNFSVKYEKADKGIVNVTVIDDGKNYQIYGIVLNRI